MKLTESHSSALTDPVAIRKQGNEHLKKGEFDQAIHCYNNSLRAALQTQQPDHIMFALNNLIAVKVKKIKSGEPAPSLLKNYIFLHKKLHELKQQHSPLYRRHRPKSLYRILEAAEHLPQQQISRYAQQYVTSHTLSTLPASPPYPLQVFSINPDGELGVKLAASSPTSIEVDMQPIAYYVGKQFDAHYRENGHGTFYPNLTTNAYVSPTNNLGAYTIGTDIPALPIAIGALINDGTLSNTTTQQRYRRFIEAPSESNIKKFIKSYKKNMKSLNNCMLVLKGTACSVVATKPISKGEQLFLPYGVGYWITKAQFLYRSRGDMQREFAITKLGFQTKLYSGTYTSPGPAEQFSLSTIKQTIDENSSSELLAKQLFKTYMHPSIDPAVVMGTFITHAVLSMSINYSTLHSIRFHPERDNWQQSLTTEWSRLTFVIPQLTIIIQHMLSRRSKNYTDQEVNKALLNCCLFSVILMKLPESNAFPSPLIMRLKQQGLFSMSIDDDEKIFNEGDYRLSC